MKKVFFNGGKSEISDSVGEIFLRKVESFPAGKDFCPNPGGNENDENEILFFSKIWKEISLKNISPRKFFFFLEKYISGISSPDFGKPQKFHDFIFSSPEFERSFWERIWRASSFFPTPTFLMKKVF